MDNIGLTWETDHGNFHIDQGTILWILKNVKTSQFSNERCYVYNKAFSRYYDNHFDHRLDNAKQVVDQYNGKTRSGALSPAGTNEDSYECCDEKNPCECMSQFDLIREWAHERGLYDKGDVKTQTLKLLEEAGEICRAVLKDDKEQIIDGIGDCVVVLTNLAELNDISIEDCIDAAYEEISNRTGKMVNGTFKKD
jgi:NTP pyrophosphatase (non-canonical NTP hydrolase)